MNGVFLVIQCCHTLAGQLAGGVNAAVVHEQVTGANRDNTQYLIAIGFHEGSRFWLGQRRQQGLEVIVAGNGAHRADTAGEPVERAGANVRGGHRIALAGIEIPDGNTFIGVGFELEIDVVRLHFQRIVLDHVVDITIGANHIEDTHLYGLG